MVIIQLALSIFGIMLMVVYVYILIHGVIGIIKLEMKYLIIRNNTTIAKNNIVIKAIRNAPLYTNCRCKLDEIPPVWIEAMNAAKLLASEVVAHNRKCEVEKFVKEMQEKVKKYEA